ncbi:hypothetical protein [Xanthobacter flavus]|uniref:hypothetical protein n=1 Tax=Xanthobacter flavus TaxID=281 RepID=UPI00372AD522
MDELEVHIEKASKLTLFDASYFLLTLYQNTNKFNCRPTDKSIVEFDNKSYILKYRRFAKYITNFVIEYISGRRRRDTCTTNTVFDWLKRAHSAEDFSTLQAAIRSAVNFDRDCTRCFEYRSGSLTIDAETAVEKAAQLNPGFGEETFSLAVHWTCIAMK